MTVTYKVHQLANNQPKLTTSEYEALVRSIDAVGQQLPVRVWRGEIVDGRARQRACIELGLELKIEVQPSSTPLEDVAMVVEALNVRRDVLPEQQLVMAYIKHNNSRLSRPAVCKEFGVKLNSLRALEELLAIVPEVEDMLFNGKEVTIQDVTKGITVTTHRIGTLLRIAKSNNELNVNSVTARDRKSS
jgi:ParB-like chromosome segregation protein Spo0J